MSPHFQSWILGVALCHAGVSSSCAYDGYTAVGETGESLVAFVREAHEDHDFTGAVLAGRDGKVIAAVGMGTLGDGSSDPIAVDTLFEIASCTKPFTAIAVMKLAEEGKLTLDDSIGEHLPGVPADCRAITVRHLLQHTSGIPRSNAEGRGKDLAAVLPTFLKGEPRTPPGERHEYWNQGYALLSEVIARASRKSYVAYMREAIFKPCGMANSRFTGQRAPKKVAVATGVSSRGANRSALDHPYGEYGFQYRGMGGLVTNLVDLWRWDRALARGKLLSSESIAEMTTPGDAGYALGWRIDRAAAGPAPHYHTGSVRGFLASIRREPAADGCLLVLSNQDDSAAFDLVREGCEAIFAGREPLKHPKPAEDVQLTPDRVAELVGVYRDKRGRTLTVRQEDQHAQATIDWGGPKTHGYLGAGEDGGLLFGMMRRYSRKGFAAADAIAAERADDTIASLKLTITQNGSAIRFARVTD